MNYYLWLDLETTGLNPKADQILEIGAVLTRGFYDEIERFHAVCIIEKQMIGTVLKMHHENGLIAQCGQSVYLEEDIINLFRTFLKRTSQEYNFTVVGNSVNFDVEFLKTRGIPEWENYTTHRVIDITSVRLFLKELGVTPKIEKPAGIVQHRVFGDLAVCQAQAEKYSTFFTRPSLLSEVVGKLSLSLRRLRRKK